MTELFEKSLPAALQADITVFAYWDMTWAEIIQVLDAHRKKLFTQVQQQAIMDYAFAGVIGRMLNGKTTSIYESYPSLFEKEEEEHTLQAAKNRIMSLATKYKSKEVE